MPTVTSALIIHPPFARMLATGRKSWEMRSSHCVQHLNETVAILDQEADAIIGVMRIADSLGPLTQRELHAAKDRHRLDDQMLAEHPGWNHAWVVTDAQLIRTPIPVERSSGPVIWFTLNPTTSLRIHYALSGKTLTGKRRAA